MECPICFEQYSDASVCATCETSMCLHCLASLKKEECPFCRQPFFASSSEAVTNDGVTANVPTFSQSYPPTTTTNPYHHHASLLPADLLDETGEWRRSRILTRQLRRERKRMDHELQQIRNAELSRLHNRQQRSKRGKNQNQMIFDMEMDADSI